MSITLPAYIKDVAKVQIYCAWAEAVLGEATFSAPMMTMDRCSVQLQLAPAA